jgi:hypothetical protein
MKKPLSVQISALVRNLGPEEKVVLLEVAKRLKMGQENYGRFDLKKDRRNWRREMTEELLDAIVYGTVGLMASK